MRSPTARAKNIEFPWFEFSKLAVCIVIITFNWPHQLSNLSTGPLIFLALFGLLTLLFARAIVMELVRKPRQEKCRITRINSCKAYSICDSGESLTLDISELPTDLNPGVQGIATISGSNKLLAFDPVEKQSDESLNC